jgi:predicted Ser/Thr protein kinase
MWTADPSYCFLVVLMIAYVESQNRVQTGEEVYATTATLSQARLALAATSSSELVIFAGGGDSLIGPPSDRVNIYNVTSGSWTTATLSVPRGCLAAVSSGNLVFFAGGGQIFNLTTLIIQNVTDSVDIYNVSDGQWSTATLSQARAVLAAASVGSLVLFGGGENKIPPNYTSSVVDIYNVTNSTWSNTTLSQARSWIAATTVANRYVLFAGGYLQTSPSNVVDIYDSTNGTWNTATLSQARSILAAASLNHSAFFAGGSNATNQTSNVVDIFNSATQTWSNTTLSQARVLLAAASIRDIVAFGGGSPDGFTASAVVDVYNITSNIWFTLNLSQPRGLLAATSSTNKIFFGGGLSNTGRSNVVDIFEFNPLLPAPNSSSTTTPIGVIVGVLLSLIVVAVVILTVIFVMRKQKKKKLTAKPVEIQQVPQRNMTEPTTIDALCRDTILHKSFYIHSYDIFIEKHLGEGSYASVFLGRWNGASVALKIFKSELASPEFLSEVKILANLPPHPNVVQVFGISVDGSKPMIIMEYCPGGCLADLLFSSKAPVFTNDQKIELVKEIARGVFHLHRHNIIHGDLAARNILLTSDKQPKITDFGMSKVISSGKQSEQTAEIGPVRWMAPESIATKCYSKKTDVWSFGILVYEIVAQHEPHEKMSLLNIAVAIRDCGLTPTIPNDCPPLLREVMELCWKKEPKERPTFETLYNLLSPRRVTLVGY